MRWQRCAVGHAAADGEGAVMVSIVIAGRSAISS